jgi:sulfonate transport system permease protein
MTAAFIPIDALRDRALFFLSPLLLVVVWGLVCRAGLFPEQILVSPLVVYESAMELWHSGELPMHLELSLFRLVSGFAIGASIGLVAGVIVALSKTAENLFSPLLNAVRQVPTIAFIPVLVLLFGVEETFKIIIVAKAAFFPVWLATYDAVRGISRNHFEVARVFKVRLHHLIIRIVLPATVPPVLTGLRLGLNRAWLVLIVAELLAADSGVGQMMELGRQMFRIDIVMVGVVVTGLIGFTLDFGFRTLEKQLVRWKHL